MDTLRRASDETAKQAGRMVDHIADRIVTVSTFGSTSGPPTVGRPIRQPATMKVFKDLDCVVSGQTDSGADLAGLGRNAVQGQEASENLSSRTVI